MPQKKYAEVIPLVRLPRTLGGFDYKIPEELAASLRPGAMVWLNFRGRRAVGIIASIGEEPSSAKSQIKSIKELLPESSWLDESSVPELLSLSERAAVSPALFLTAALPAAPQKIYKAAPRAARARRSPPFLISANQKNQLVSVFQKIKTSPDSFVRIRGIAGSMPILARLAAHAQKHKEHLQIIAPTFESAQKLTAELFRRGANPLFLDKRNGKNAQFSAWLAARDAPTVISAPLAGIAAASRQKNGRVVLFDEANPNWKLSETNPKFDAREAIARLAKRRGLNILRLGAIPSLAFWKASGKNQTADFAADIPSEIIDMNVFWRSGGSGPLSDAALAAAQEDKKIFILNYRVGRAAALICKDCQFTALCETCAESLSVRAGSLYCPLCKNKSDLPISCPKCNGTNLLELGAGAERVREIIGVKATVGTLRDLARFYNSGELFDITIFADPESMLARPFFYSREECAWALGALLSITNPNGKIILQTRNPELSLWKITEGKYEKFLEEELFVRKEMELTPYSRAAKITSRNVDPEAADKLIQTAALKLKPFFPNILGPFHSRPPYLRGMHRRHVIIKYKDKDAPALFPLIRELPDELIIDLDSRDLL